MEGTTPGDGYTKLLAALAEFLKNQTFETDIGEQVDALRELAAELEFQLAVDQEKTAL